MKRILTFVGLCGAACSLSAQPFALVENGVSRVRFEGVTAPAMALAVSECNRVIKAVTGADAARESAPNVIAFRVDPTLGESDTYEISVSPEAGAGRVELVGNNARSCWFAMVDLLNQLGCRWFWEGDEGEFLPPPAKTLRLDVKPKKTTAAFPWRQLPSHPNRERELFFARNRLNPIGRGKVDWGQTTNWGGHSFNWIRPLDCKTPQEYFARFPEQWAEMDGVRVDGNHCYTNPDTIRTFQTWILDFWERNPDVEFLTLTARDSPVYCHCKTCAKMDSSTLFFNFLNEITKPAIAKYPDKRYVTIAYAFYSSVPKVRLNDRFLLHYCMYDRCYKHRLGSDCPVNPNALGAMRAWKEALGYAPNVYGYHFDAFGGGTMMIPLAGIFQDEMRWARDFGVKFWFTEYYGGYADKGKPRETWGILARRWSAWAAMSLMWDPDADLEALRKDFCDRVFGAAGAEMAAYLRRMEDAWEGAGHISYYNNSPASISDGFVRDPELVAQVDALFATARQKAAGDARAAREVATEKALWGAWRELATGPSMAKRWTMKIPYSKAAPNMDGTGTDPVWDAAGVTEKEFVRAKRPCRKDPTWATLLRTDDALYLRFIGWGDTKDLAALKTKNDTDCYLDDGLEMCLDPMNTRTDYYWLCVNTRGAYIDALASLGMNINKKWNGRWRRATKVYPDRWVIECEFPYATFGKPLPGKAWLMGLNRCGPMRYESWTDATVHSPNSFRTLIME